MERKPKPKNEGLFAKGFGVQIILQGIMFGILALVAFYLGEKFTGTEAGGQTLAFMVLALSQVVQSFNMRSEHSIFKIGPFTNKNLNVSTLISFVLVLLVLFTPLRIAFGLEILSLKLYLIGVGLILVPLVVMELSKLFGFIKMKH